MASADGMCALLRQSEQSMPDRTANTLGNNRGITVQLCVRSFRLSWHRYTGDAEDSIFVLEGLLEQETGLNPTEMTDTAGASELCLWPFLAAGIPVFSTPRLMPVLRFSTMDQRCRLWRVE